MTLNLKCFKHLISLFLLLCILHYRILASDYASTLPDTQILLIKDDIASLMIEGIDRFLLRQTELSVEKRAKYWNRNFESPSAYNLSIQTNRERLAYILGVRDKLSTNAEPEIFTRLSGNTIIASGENYQVQQIRWRAFGDVYGEGLILSPTEGEGVCDVIAVPDSDQTPEQIAGLTDGLPIESQFARILAQSGCRVVVPTLINRAIELHKGKAALPCREFIQRPAYELGRTVFGFEVEKLISLINWLSKPNQAGTRRIGIIGYGDGGLIALYTGALDTRVDAVAVCGAFDSRIGMCKEPLDRNVFGLLEQFGGAELASMVAPRMLIIEASKFPDVTITGKGKEAPGKITTPPVEDVQREFERARKITEPLKTNWIELIVPQNEKTFAAPETLAMFLTALSKDAHLNLAQTKPEVNELPNIKQRHSRQLDELDRYTQWLLEQSQYTRQEFMSNLDFSSLDAYSKSTEKYRQFFKEKIIGWFDEPFLPFNARTRRAYTNGDFIGYEVVLDVFADVIAYGILLLPKDIKQGEKRPVVVCQHGLEGRPQDVVSGDNRFYHNFAANLTQRGFITFSPQNPYLFGHRFRTLQRKANPLGKTLFSIITAQHQQIINWLKTLPQVDRERIGFYGLSYGGKTAMRVPAILTDYKLSICSADFNEWVWKNASTTSPYSYVWTCEYEIFEFDLGNTFNYFEMAALIAPRPFMVERGHFDNVAPDETVAYEYAKVRRLYSAKLKIPERTTIEWFVGPHTIHGKGTFEFLEKFLMKN